MRFRRIFIYLKCLTLNRTRKVEAKERTAEEHPENQASGPVAEGPVEGNNINDIEQR